MGRYLFFFFELLPLVSHTLRVQTNPESPAGIPVNGVTDFSGVRTWHLRAKWRDPHLRDPLQTIKLRPRAKRLKLLNDRLLILLSHSFSFLFPSKFRASQSHFTLLGLQSRNYALCPLHCFYHVLPVEFLMVMP